MAANLTDLKIRRAAPTPEGDYKLYDGAGLYLLVKATGSKYWRYRYRIGGKENLLALGIYPTVSLSAARKAAENAKDSLRRGIDPNSQKRDEKRERQAALVATFEKQARVWCEHKYGTWKPTHFQTVVGSFEKDVFPMIGARPIALIEATELRRVVKAVEKRGALDIARRIAFRLNQVFIHARLNGVCDRNPAEGLSGLVKPKRVEHYAALKENALPAFLNDLEAYHGSRLTLLLVRFALLTAVRSLELRGARWAEFDLDAKMWRIPGERMKMKQEHIVPLSRQSLETLASIRELTGDRSLLFPNRNRPDQPCSDGTVNKALADLGYAGKATGHGFRSTFSTLLNERGFNRDWIERQLAHVERSEVRAAYNSAEYLEQRRGMMQAWADILDAAQHGATVLPFKGKTAA